MPVQSWEEQVRFLNKANFSRFGGEVWEISNPRSVLRSSESEWEIGECENPSKRKRIPHFVSRAHYCNRSFSGLAGDRDQCPSTSTWKSPRSKLKNAILDSFQVLRRLGHSSEHLVHHSHRAHLAQRARCGGTHFLIFKLKIFFLDLNHSLLEPFLDRGLYLAVSRDSDPERLDWTH